MTSRTQLINFIAAAISLFIYLPHALGQEGGYQTAYTVYQTQDFEQAEKIWTDLAKAGDMNAQYALGVMHLRGEASNSSPEQAYEWFNMAAKQGHSTAMFNVGVAYWEGSGVAKDREQALQWWERSANGGDSGARFNLGLAYYLGETREPNLELAVKWISLAAKQNHPEAHRILQAINEENPGLVSAQSSQPSESATAASIETTAQVADPVPQETKEEESSSTPEPVIQNDYWKTGVSTTNLHANPQDNSPIFSSLPKDTPVEIIASRGNWTKITLPDGIKTWIFNKYLIVQGESGIINGTSVRVRPHPSTDNLSSPPLGAYRNGVQVKILDRREGWIQVRAPKDIGGWVLTSDLVQYRDSEENRRRQWESKVSEGF